MDIWTSLLHILSKVSMTIGIICMLLLSGWIIGDIIRMAAQTIAEHRFTRPRLPWWYRNGLASLHDWFEDKNRLRCKDCGCRDRYEVDTGYEGPYVSNRDVCCMNCDAVCNEWAYGYYTYPSTYKQRLWNFPWRRYERWRDDRDWARYAKTGKIPPARKSRGYEE